MGVRDTVIRFGLTYVDYRVAAAYSEIIVWLVRGSDQDGTTAMNAASSEPIIERVLLADIGGTNARFALLAGGTVGAIVHMAVSDYSSFCEALDKYLGKMPEAGTIWRRNSGCFRPGQERPLRPYEQFLGDRCRRAARCLRAFHRCI